MMHEGLSLLPSGVFVSLAMTLLAATGVLCWLGWIRSGYRPVHGALELLRFLLAGLIVFSLCQPEWLYRQPSERRPQLVILSDQSGSMQTQDVLAAGSNKPISRADAIKPLLAESHWKSDTASDWDVLFETFSSPKSTPDGTDLNRGLSNILDRHSNLLGVVVLSDGDWNVGNSPVEAATKYRLDGVPVYTIGVGSKIPLPDLELVRMDAPTFGVAGKPMRIPFVVKSTLGQDRDVNVTLSVRAGAGGTDDQRASDDRTHDRTTDVISKVIRVPAMGRANSNMIWNPTTTGEFKLTIQVPKDAQELIDDNNFIMSPISIRKEQLRVLVVESYPRWEYRYLRNALERDPGVQVTCLLFHPELPKVGGGRDYIKVFPTTDQLSEYDVVVLGDVGIGPKQLNQQDILALRQLVSAQAAGLILMPGRNGAQDSLLSSSLRDLYPVVMDRARTNGVGSSSAGHFLLTQAGRQSLLTQLGDNSRSSDEVWNSLPGFHWYAAVQRGAAGAEVLAVHERDSTSSGRVPLIATKTYGTGKVLFMGTDSAWKWREGVEDRYHYRFWGQVARWMAYQRQMAEGQSMRLFFSPDRPQVDDVISLNANVLDPSGGPLRDGSVVVQAVSPSGKSQSIRLQAGEGDAWALFVGSFTPQESGTYQLVASCAESGAIVKTTLSVQGLSRERPGQLARYDVLEEIATITNGNLVEISKTKTLLDDLANLPAPEPVIHRTRIWSHPLWGGTLIVLMGVFWTGRKMVGVV